MIVTLVTMENPCTACVIIDNLLCGLFDKLSTNDEYKHIQFEVKKLRHPKEVTIVEGLEVEKLPAIIIDGEQVTAGSLLHRRQLMEYINARM